jgi:hypothetical protein
MNETGNLAIRALQVAGKMIKRAGGMIPSDRSHDCMYSFCFFLPSTPVLGMMVDDAGFIFLFFYFY